MTNLTHDEIIQYGLNHEDETIRELAQRFQDYRNVVLRLKKTEHVQEIKMQWDPEAGGFKTVN